MTKRCQKCNEILALDCFTKNRGSKDGLQAHCRACSREYRIQGEARKKAEAERLATETKTCVRCHEEMALDQFARGTRPPYCDMCIPCFDNFRSEQRIQDIIAGCEWTRSMEFTIDRMEAQFETTDQLEDRHLN